ncbi:hypothetical protein ARMGADRAFT_978124 [Armillaria gallica]|uniref:Peptidase C14 caspase domain-containing protein n=1 Tax=Armillaria gallica TaxID=47427 RepID=A0A2H3EAM4_ARMGA|nr:hypothetical protein ARMGADRAFT_978124 [Armillaria gallica]
MIRRHHSISGTRRSDILYFADLSLLGDLLESLHPGSHPLAPYRNQADLDTCTAPDYRLQVLVGRTGRDHKAALMSEKPNPHAGQLVPEMVVDDSLGTKLVDRNTNHELCNSKTRDTLASKQKISDEDVSASRIFALVIGVNTYEGEKYKEFQLTGAVRDADDFQRYLLDDLRVPNEHITNLRDKEATRTAIIQGFRALGSDERIVRDQAIIIIYFAGHGATADKPSKGWSEWISADDKIELLCPTDMGLPARKNVIEGIPDRTISQLLAEISNAKGNNITLILDCCHSAGINRGGDDALNMRSRRLLEPPEISPDCDSTILSLAPKSQVATSRISGTPWDSHILLAACSRVETAKEVDGKGGLFTHALLNVMRERRVARGELTYASLMRYLYIPSQQTPHLEGKHIHQSMFSLWNAASPRIACSYEDGQFFLTLYAGSLHGITLGSTFHIYRTDQVSDSVAFMTSVAVTHVGSFASRLDLQVRNPDLFSQHVWYAQLVTLSGSNFTINCNNSSFLTRVLGSNSRPELLLTVGEVTSPGEADLCLTVEEMGGEDLVFFDRGGRKQFLSAKSTGLPSRLPNIYSKINDIPRLRNIINHYAHFTSHLDTSNLHPLTKFVSITMTKLDGGKQPIGPNLLSGEENEPIQISVDKALRKSPHCYGFTINSISDVDLYVYLFYFDASTLEIDAWYGARTSTIDGMEGGRKVDPCLRARKTLCLGYGSAGVKPIEFNMPKDQNIDVCFFKFFVSMKTVDLGSISQKSLLQRLYINRGAAQVESPSPPPPVLDNCWASKTIPVIQVLENPSVKARDPDSGTGHAASSSSPSSPPLSPTSVSEPLSGGTNLTHPPESPGPAQEDSGELMQRTQWLLDCMQTLRDHLPPRKAKTDSRTLDVKNNRTVFSHLTDNFGAVASGLVLISIFYAVVCVARGFYT